MDVSQAQANLKHAGRYIDQQFEDILNSHELKGCTKASRWLNVIMKRLHRVYGDALYQDIVRNRKGKLVYIDSALIEFR